MSIKYLSTNRPPDELITLNRAAKLAGVRLATVYRWVLKRKLRAWKSNGRPLVSEADVRSLFRPAVPRRTTPFFRYG